MDRITRKVMRHASRRECDEKECQYNSPHLLLVFPWLGAGPQVTGSHQGGAHNVNALLKGQNRLFCVHLYIMCPLTWLAQSRPPAPAPASLLSWPRWLKWMARSVARMACSITPRVLAYSAGLRVSRIRWPSRLRMMRAWLR